MSRVTYRAPRERQPAAPRRLMARPLHEPARGTPPPDRRPSPRQLIGPTLLLLIAGAAGAGLLGFADSSAGELGTAPSASPHASVLAYEPSPTPSPPPTATERPPRPNSGSSNVGTPRGTPTPPPAAEATPAPPAPTASPTPRPLSWAPQSAADFDQTGEVIDIAFPFKPGARYRYRDNWFDLRAGSPNEYNHVHSRRRGELRRAHDGIDIYVRRGTPVVAPFAGTVIDPADRWSPWDDRYGGTVAIVSSEPQSEGYAALMVHLDAVFVEPGTQVRRGEVVGLAGDTGNADGFRVHLHFELRAPFSLPWLEPGGERLVDAFNPFPSLVAADPRRN